MFGGLTYFLVLCMATGFVVAEIANDLDAEDVKKQLSEHIPELNNIDSKQIPSVDELDAIFREKCDKKSGNGTYDLIKENKEKYMECISNFVDVNKLKEEVEEAKKTGSMDEVFGKYCNKFPELSNCSSDLLDELSPCLEDKEIETINTTMSIMVKLKDFMCFKNGDRIAMFVAEGGVECIQSKKTELQDCLNSTFSSRVSNNDTSMPLMLPIVLFDSQDCNDFQKFRTCVGKALETCKESTPANLVDAFFKFTKKILPCNVTLTESDGKGSANNILPTLFLVLASSLAVYFH